MSPSSMLGYGGIGETGTLMWMALVEVPALSKTSSKMDDSKSPKP